MYKVISIIGTRPQYIKIKPFYDFCKQQTDIEHIVLDTQQHYSPAVSSEIIADLGLEIDYFLECANANEIDFMGDTLKELKVILDKEQPDFVLAYGDTNSTFCAALTCYKMGIPMGHVEANLRCNDIDVPEEVNRIFADLISTVRFCSTKKVVDRSDFRDVFVGDLEYELLNNLNPEVAHKSYALMTLHRQSNTNATRLAEVMKFCARVPYTIKFFVHHRTKPLLQHVDVPPNLEVYDSCPYKVMASHLAACKFIITDSGGLNKTSAFFGKKCLVLRDKMEWIETEKVGFALRSQDLGTKDLSWLLSPPLSRNKRFYLSPKMNPSQIIYNKIMTILSHKKGNK